MFSYPCLGFHTCISPGKAPGRTKKFSSCLLFQDLLWRDLWERDLETCPLEQWLFWGARLRGRAADCRRMMFFPWLHHHLSSSSYILLCAIISDHCQEVFSSGCVYGYLESDPVASQGGVMDIPAKPPHPSLPEVVLTQKPSNKTALPELPNE